MALSILLYIEIAIVVTFALFSLFMFVPTKKEKSQKVFFALSVILALALTTITAISLPSNYQAQIIAAWCGLIPAGLGVIISVAKGRPNWCAKLLVMVSSVYAAAGYLIFM